MHVVALQPAGGARPARSCALFAVLSAVLCLLPAASVRAYEDQATLGVGVAYAHAFGRSPVAHGAGVELAGSLGVSEALAVRAVLSYGWHPSDGPALHAGFAGAEFVYLLDVLEVVPWAGVGADASLLGRAGDLRLGGAAHLVIGLDYLLSRSLTLSLQARPYCLLGELESEPLYATFGLAAAFMFDTY